MKIFIAAQGYPTKIYPMNGIHEFVYAKQLKKAGMEAVICSVDLRSIRRKRKFGFEHISIGDVQVYNYNFPLGAVNKKILGYFTKKVFSKLFRKALHDVGACDIIHSHWTDISYGVAKFNKNHKYPLIITEHSSIMTRDNLSRDLYETAKYAYENANKVLVANDFFKNKLENKFDAEFEINPILTDIEFFKYDFEVEKSETFTVVSTGNLKESKGHRETIKAFSKVFKGKNVKLYIFGEGEDRENLERLIESEKLSTQVTLKGFVNPNELKKYYETAHLYICASHMETFGKSVLEALSSGLPCVITDCYGPVQFIDKQNGKIVPVKDISSLSKAMEYIYNNMGKYSYKDISDRINEKYSNENLVKGLIDIYKGVLCDIKNG